MPDKIVEEVRKTRDDYARQFDYDLHAMCEDLRNLQQLSGAQVVSFPKRPVRGDDHEMFLTLVFAEIERRWNKTPPFEIVPPNPKKKHGGKEYQARCLEVLQWLHAESNITSLEVSSES